ncbi:hypothetical protein B0T20DRAFT_342271, partial [Sordaria brevicollis]
RKVIRFYNNLVRPIDKDIIFTDFIEDTDYRIIYITVIFNIGFDILNINRVI